MRVMLRNMSNSTFYFSSIFMISVYISGIYFIFKKYLLAPPLFIFLVVGLYPLVCALEQHNERSLERRSEKEEKEGYSFTFLREGDIKSSEGYYSLFILVIIGMVATFIILMRLLYPNAIDLESTVYAGLALWLSFYVYRERKKVN